MVIADMCIFVYKADSETFCEHHWGVWSLSLVVIVGFVSLILNSGTYFSLINIFKYENPGLIY